MVADSMAVAADKAELVDYAERFAAQGYLAISIDYRLARQVPELNPQFASLYESVGQH
jgi:acetyl esterase/lipase